jgi:hypothetical protein
MFFFVFCFLFFFCQFKRSAKISAKNYDTFRLPKVKYPPTIMNNIMLIFAIMHDTFLE